jgi:hypothetical protein
VRWVLIPTDHKLGTNWFVSPRCGNVLNNGVSTLVSNVNSTLDGVTTNISVGPAPNLNCVKSKMGKRCRWPSSVIPRSD